MSRSRDARAHLRDILESIEHISSYLVDVDLEAYLADRKTRSAVERELQIITEAAIRLGNEADALCPGPDWKNIRGLGNILRHVYHRVDDRIIWNAVQEDLPPVRKAVDRALVRLQGALKGPTTE